MSKNENKNTVKGGDTNIRISNSMSMPVKLLLGGATATALLLGGGAAGSEISKAGQEEKLDKILEIVTETKVKVSVIETEIGYIKEDVKDNKEEIKKKKDK